MSVEIMSHTLFIVEAGKPTNLTISGGNSTTVSLSWVEPANAVVDRYIVYCGDIVSIY